MTCVYYIDIFFLVNWMMNVAILMLCGKFLRRQIYLGRLGIAAALGGGWACLTIGISWSQMTEGNLTWLREIISFFLWGMNWFAVPFLMLEIVYPDKQWRERIQSMFCLYLSAVLFGGVTHLIWENTSFGQFWQIWMSGSDGEAVSIWLLALAMLSGMTIIELGRRYRQLSSGRERIQEVILNVGERQWIVKALWDSGNQLQDPFSGRPVHIVEEKEVKELLGDQRYQNLMEYLEQGSTRTADLPLIRMIPCRSLGSAHTLLPVMSIDRIHLADGSTLTKPLIGLSRIPLSDDGSFCMLLHSQTDEMRRSQ